MSSAGELRAMPLSVEEVAPVVVSRRRPLPRKVIVGASVVAVFAVIAIAAPLIAPANPDAQNIAERLQDPSSQHLLGTDALGRDELSRLIYATRIDLPVAVLA